MQKAIIHTTTRVIRRLTTDDNPQIADDESIVNLAANIDIGGGFWKLDVTNKKVAAITQEIDDAGVDENRRAASRTQKVIAFNNIVADLADNGVTLPKIQLYFKALKDLK